MNSPNLADVAIDFTIVIPTYNGANRLPRVLERLKTQINSDAIIWEIVIVDNNSTDATRQVIETYQRQWEDGFLKYYFEPKQGAAFARNLALRMARGPLVGFLDDDNLPSETWLDAAYRFAQRHPQVGAYGGQIHPEFEVEPDPEFKPLAIYLAIVERGSKPYCYTRQKRVLPPTAGLVVRREAWLNHVPSDPFLTGPTPHTNLASEDIAAIAHIQNAGWEIWYNPEMHLTHQIPERRLQKKSLLKLIQGVGLAKHHIRMIRLHPWQRPIAFLGYFLNDLMKLSRYWITHARSIDYNVHHACELQLLVSTVISPFYLLIYSFKRQSLSSSHPV